MSSWTCDGVPKDGKQYPGASPHTPQQNTGPDCIICGLPQEAMQPGKTGNKPAKTVVAGSSSNGTPAWLVPVMIVVALLLIGGGVGSYLLLKPKNQPLESISSPSPTDTTVNPTQGENVSRGEQILLKPTPNKEAGAKAFEQKNWPEAIASYQTAVKEDPNDPEGLMYLNNSKAQKAGNPITIAVAVPTTISADSAAEILRGVAKYQTEYNQSSPPSGRLLEVAIIDSSDPMKAPNIAQEIINTADILGIVGYGIDPGSQAALKQYEQAGIAVLSPLTSSFNKTGGKPTLRTISVEQKGDELLVNYLQAVGKTLTQYASKQQPSPAIVLFSNPDSSYSQQLQQEIINSLPAVKGTVIEQIDINSPNFNPGDAISSAQQKGAKIAILALSKNQVTKAVEIAKANQNSASPLILMGGDELYNADILVKGGDAIAGMVLAVPWSFSPNDPFAKDAINSWKGRVSWRTATAYDATKALIDTVSKTPDRAAIAQAFNQGVILTDSTTNFNLFDEVPLVKAVKGNQGPKGSNYQFDPLK
ncbi:ABC transporter substrate-binding protein [Crocosphaera sp. UHCC 0190]|uniref:ABC transporter substrate-binding protein n=1 Tax=Crocosphaera sp. UHCC 0190 TaxID=3110246 RepID=UPI002B1ED23A|nr:ABC transporter substrate-binding protein [Crocosphaera sp. UHCC 0190]MEA5510411.1 ABC transporter substrate-binding protein [Crocosphaera sp. UHCC 0190]